MIKFILMITGFVVWVILLIFVLTVGILIWNYKRKIAANKKMSEANKFLNSLNITSEELQSTMVTLIGHAKVNEYRGIVYRTSPLAVVMAEKVVKDLLESVGIDRPE